MATRTLVRALHTSRSVLAEAAPKAAPKSAQQLGFSDEKRAARVLPSLDVSKSAREVIGEKKARQPRPPRKPKADTAAALKAAEHVAADTSRKSKMDSFDIPAEFFEGADLAPAVPTASSSRSRDRQAQAKNKREQGDRKPREFKPRDGKPRDGKPRDGKPRNDRSPRNPRAPRETVETVYSSAAPVVQIVRDVSPRGLFGATSILSPRPSGAVDATASFWAKDMDRAAVFKAESLRRLGSYDLFLPAYPKQTKDAKQNAIAQATWVMGMNPTISMRASAKGVEAIKKLI